MKKFTPIAMKCSQENWDSIKNMIPNNWINDGMFDFIEYPYLTNNFYSGGIFGIGTHLKDFIKKNVKIIVILKMIT